MSRIESCLYFLHLQGNQGCFSFLQPHPTPLSSLSVLFLSGFFFLHLRIFSFISFYIISFEIFYFTLKYGEFFFHDPAMYVLTFEIWFFSCFSLKRHICFLLKAFSFNYYSFCWLSLSFRFTFFCHVPLHFTFYHCVPYDVISFSNFLSLNFSIFLFNLCIILTMYFIPHLYLFLLSHFLE